jgi:hypothetical protein
VANLYRLIVLLLLCVSNLHAMPRPENWTVSGFTGSWSTAALSCPGAAAAATNTSYTWSGVLLSGSGVPLTNNTCAITSVLKTTGASSTGNYQTVGSYLSCPANSTLSGNSCVCANGFNDTGSACVSPQQLKCAAISGGVDLFTGSTFILPDKPYCPSTGNGSGCGGKVTGGFATVKNNVKTWTTEVTYDGTTCNPVTTGSTPNSVVGEALTTCKGQLGTVNGVSVCIPFSSSNPPASAVSSSTTTNADNSKSSSTNSTECVGSKCTTTTTTTTTTAAGAVTTATTKQDVPKDDFCKNNPRSTFCITSSYTDAPCTAPPVCDGDAVACAIADQARKTACALTAGSAEADLYQANKTPLTGSQVPSGGIVDLGPSAFNTSDTIGVSGGLSDISITVWNKPVTIPMANLNQYLSMIGNVLMAVAFLTSIKIVRG